MRIKWCRGGSWETEMSMHGTVSEPIVSGSKNG